MQRESRGEFVRKVLIASAITAGLVLLLLFIGEALYVLLLLFAGILLAVFLRGLAGFVSPWIRLPIVPTLALVIVLLFGVSGLFVWLVTPNIAEQFQELGGQLQASAGNVRSLLENTKWGEEIIALLPEPGDIFTQAGDILRQARGVFSTTVGVITGLFIVFFTGLYMAFDPDVYVRGFLSLFPKGARERMAEVLEALRVTILHWLLARLVGMTVIGVFTWIGLMLLDVPLALSLGLFAGIMTFIPNLGPILSVVPAVLLVLPDGLGMVTIIVGLYLGIQFVESYFITPLVQQYAIALPPVLNISAQLVMGIFSGILGLILATPMVATVMVLVRMLYIEDVLGKDIGEPVPQPGEA